MKLLIQFPTRERPYEFFKHLKQYIHQMRNSVDIDIHISMDIDDEIMNNDECKIKLKSWGCYFSYNDNKTKHEAVNKIIGIPWDILLLASDDMWPIQFGYDEIIRQDMKKYFSDTDGALWYYDGNRKDLNTLQIIGRKYYDRFKYIYREEYKSFYGDTEFQQVAESLNKLKYIDKCIIKHNHYSVTHLPMDSLYNRNDKFAVYDGKAFNKRKEAGFPID